MNYSIHKGAQVYYWDNKFNLLGNDTIDPGKLQSWSGNEKQVGQTNYVISENHRWWDKPQIYYVGIKRTDLTPVHKQTAYSNYNTMGLKTDMKPEEAVALSLIHCLLDDYPETVSAILAQHEVQPSTDPEDNILALAKLSAARGRFFNEDFAKACASVNFHGAEMMPEVISQYVSRQTDYPALNFDLGVIKNVTNGSDIGNLLKDVFSKENPGVIGTGIVGPKDVAKSPAATKIMEAAKTTSPDSKTPAAGKKILGLVPWMFYSALAFVIILIIIIIILIVRSRKKKKTAEEKK